MGNGILCLTDHWIVLFGDEKRKLRIKDKDAM